MAAPSYTTDLQDITLAESTTGWSALGGGASGLGTGADFSMQGTLCVDKQVSAAEKGQLYNNGSTITPGANEHFFVWVFLATPGVTATLANRGLGIVIGTSTTVYNTFHVEGSDTYGAAGRVGKCYPIRYVTTSSGSAPYRTLTGSPGANPQYFGATANITGTVKGANLGVDAIRRGTGVFVTDGELANPGTFLGMASTADNVSNRWGILSLVGASFELQGRFVVGRTSGGTPTAAYFDASNNNVLFVDTPHSQTDFTQIIVDHASTVFNLTNYTFKAGGTNNRGRLIYATAGITSALTGCTFDGMSITTLVASVVADGCTWRGCDAITAPGCVVTNSLVSNSTVASNASALVWNANVDPDGKLDGTTFVRGTTTNHAIEFGTSSPLSMTLRGMTFTNYNAANNSNDSTLHIKRTTGTVTINLIGCSGNISYRTDGASVVLVNDPVTATVSVINSSAAAVSGARVFVQAADGTGPFPYLDSVSITRSGAVATVTHTAHGLATNDKVIIKGATQPEYNGVHSITYLTDNTYTFDVSGTPATPATGAPTSTYVLFDGTTDGNGEITLSRVFPSDQPVTGWARKSSSAPYYKQAAIVATVGSSTGLSATVQLISDE